VGLKPRSWAILSWVIEGEQKDFHGGKRSGFLSIIISRSEGIFPLPDSDYSDGFLEIPRHLRGQRENPRMVRCLRPAYSLVELLIVVAIVGLLIGLILPAIQRVRESANRIRCGNNLRQIGLACHAYVSREGQFPDGGWGWFVQDGWLWQLAPDYEGPTAYWMANRLASCPSRRPLTPATTWGIYQGQHGTLTDYAAATTEDIYQSTGMNPYVVPAPQTLYGGIIVRRGGLPRSVRPENCHRGLSNILLVGEKWVPTAGYGGGLWFDDATWANGWDADVIRETTVPPIPDQQAGTGRQFGSAHPGGFQALFADGSVRWIHYAIDRQLWRQVARR
jgi:prepilin-type processing-associated H-X9-DG protein